jgi:H+-transporting ATPase
MLTWVINKVTKVVQLVGLLMVGFFMIDKMVLSLLGMSLLVFALDFVTMSLATDNVKHTVAPNNWNVRDITLASLAVGGIFVLGGIITLLWGKDYLHLNFPQLQTFILLMLVFTSQFRVISVRERRFFWDSLPGGALTIATLGGVIAFIFLGIYGIIIPAITPGEVFAILLFSVVFTFVTDLPKYYAFKKFGVE